jgi:lactoylglutathione lyase
MKPAIGLITILTDHIEPMKDFYSHVMGFEILEDLGNYVEFTNRGTRFALCTRQVMHQHTDHSSYTKKPAGQSFELAFPAGEPEHVHTWYRYLVARGTTPVKPPELMPWGRVTAFIADPDGNIHELYSDKAE